MYKGGHWCLWYHGTGHFSLCYFGNLIAKLWYWVFSEPVGCGVFSILNSKLSFNI